MSHTVEWSVRALNTASRFLADDSPGLAQVFACTALLAEDPRPDGAFPYGGAIFRIHVGLYRVTYEIVTDRHIKIINLARGRS